MKPRWHGVCCKSCLWDRSQRWHISELSQWKESLGGKQPLDLWGAWPSSLLQPVGWVLSSFRWDDQISRESSKVDFFGSARRWSQTRILLVCHHPDPPSCQNKDWLWMIIRGWASSVSPVTPWGIRLGAGSLCCCGFFFKHLIAIPEGEPEMWRKMTLQKQRDFACVAIQFLPWVFVLIGPVLAMWPQGMPRSFHGCIKYWVGDTYALMRPGNSKLSS